MLFTLGVGLAKGSVLLLYKRIFSLNRRMSRGVNIVAAIVSNWELPIAYPAQLLTQGSLTMRPFCVQVISWCVAIELVILLQCQPISAFWDVSVEGNCLDFRELNLVSAIGHTITTLIVVMLPQPLIWKLNMSWSKKLAYSGICLLGIA